LPKARRPHDPRRQQLCQAGLGKAILVAREAEVARTLASGALELHENVEVTNARLSDRNVDYANFLYERLQRNGFLLRDCQRMVNQDRNVFAACMVAMGDADAMVTGLTRNFSVALDNVRRAIDHRPGHRPIGVSMALVRGVLCSLPTPRFTNCHLPMNWPTSPRKQPAWHAALAMNRASRFCPIRPSVIRAASVLNMCERQYRSSTSGRSISNMTERWVQTSHFRARPWRSIPSAD